MTQTTKSKLTFEEYLNYDDGTDTRYELSAGELVVMPPETRENSLISLFLFADLLKLLPITQLCHKDTDIEVTGALAQTRIPDLMVLTEELSDILGNQRGTITRDMPPPLLVVEVVSPGNQNEVRDYRYERSEYAARGIPEYWTVDPQQKKMTVFTLVDGLYELAEFTGSDEIQSQVIPLLKMQTDRLLKAGRPG